MLKPGVKAPAISLPDQTGATCTLRQFAGRRVLVFFYPKADTPGCTQQACGLRDVADRIGDTQVIGISPDPVAKQARFDTKHGLGFPLLADTEHAVAEAYGVWKQKSLYGRTYLGIERSAFLVGPTGKLEQLWYGISAKDTPLKLLEALGEQGGASA
jgi:peroxiredoxin Q/BCP